MLNGSEKIHNGFTNNKTYLKDNKMTKLLQCVPINSEI